MSVHEQLIAAKKAKGGVWKNTPQRSRLRRALFQIHLWVGIVLTIYAVAIGITGSLLVFADEIEARLEPGLHRVAESADQAPLQPVLEQVKAAHPKQPVFSFVQAEDGEHTATFALFPAGGKLDRSRITSVYFNSHTGKILGERTTVQGPLGWARNLHYFLFGAETGLIVNGAMGIAMVVMCVSGIFIWWPGILRWKRSLGVSHRSNWKRFNWDLHSSVGFWSCAALLLVSFTGVYFAFPRAVAGLTIISTRTDLKQLQKQMAPVAPLPHDPAAKAITLDEVVAHVEGWLPNNKPLSYVVLPAGPKAVYSVGQYAPGSAPFARIVTFDVDPYSGKLLRRQDTGEYPLGMRIVQYYHALHFGNFGGDGLLGLCTKILWVLLGLVPAILGITGLIMYWNRYARKLQVFSR